MNPATATATAATAVPAHTVDIAAQSLGAYLAFRFLQRHYSHPHPAGQGRIITITGSGSGGGSGGGGARSTPHIRGLILVCGAVRQAQLRQFQPLSTAWDVRQACHGSF